MVDSPATGDSSGQMTAVFLQFFNVTFTIGVLVGTDDDRLIVLPKIEDDLVILYPV
ncbi:MAG: hypothetical protein IKR24_00460 [Erysipelotrichaceae bacterium]|nr:hypothetical protein [Erysipelotrichaceae bacterium]